VIREAKAGEAATLAGIQRDASLAALAHVFPPELYAYPLDDVTRRWEDFLADGEVTVLVAEENGSVTGVAGCRYEWLDGLYVLPQWWKRGVGRALHDEVLARLRADGCERCHLWVLEQNDGARRFYERLGWAENGSSRVVPFPPKPIDVGYSIAL
jgi:GNAT superfamily N-acetyltransferase